jgi:hypothetical protein
MLDDAVRVAVFFANEGERERAEHAFASVGPAEPVEYSGVLEGWLTLDAADGLVSDGLAVQLLDPEFHFGGLSPELTVAYEAVEGFKREARYATLEGELDALFVGEQEAETFDPRIHQFLRYDATPTPEDALPSDVYFIFLTGPITQAQRLEFDSFGVDIGAFLPPNRYRTFLDREQYARVLELPYVEHVVRYGFEDALTPELIEVAEAARSEGPSLLAVEDEPILTFDCLLHRDRDLPKVRRLIEATEGVSVIATSNLRIRFEGPVNRPLLAALASLPAVRKLSPYTPPEL